MPRLSPLPARRLRRTRAGLLLVLTAALTGCQTVNGLVYGLERDVDTAVAAIDRLTADLLPAAGPSPQKPVLTHVNFPDKPDPHARHTRFGKSRR